jgi:hypothetical protein
MPSARCRAPSPSSPGPPSSRARNSDSSHSPVPRGRRVLPGSSGNYRSLGFPFLLYLCFSVACISMGPSVFLCPSVFFCGFAFCVFLWPAARMAESGFLARNSDDLFARGPVSASYFASGATWEIIVTALPNYVLFLLWRGSAQPRCCLLGVRPSSCDIAIGRSDVIRTVD